MPRPICASCQKEMRCRQNGILVNDPPIDEFPATYWFGDLYSCVECGAGVVVGCGEPVMAPHGPFKSMEFTR